MRSQDRLPMQSSSPRAGFIDRVIGGDTSGIDEAIAKLEDPDSDGGSVDN
jgi:hypothetical protein